MQAAKKKTAGNMSPNVGTKSVGDDIDSTLIQALRVQKSRANMEVDGLHMSCPSLIVLTKN